MRTHWFLPETPDVLATLGQQAGVTLAGAVAFAAWAHGDPAQEATVRSLEHEADEVRRGLARQLRAAFSTPIDQEDLYSLSELLDAVLNSLKNVVREADVLALPPDPAIAAMADEIVDGTRHLVAALSVLTDEGDQATVEADATLAAERRMEKTYRAAMCDLLEVDDLRSVVARRELYRRLLEAGERMASVAERVWYAVVKQS